MFHFTCNHGLSPRMFTFAILIYYITLAGLPGFNTDRTFQLLTLTRKRGKAQRDRRSPLFYAYLPVHYDYLDTAFYSLPYQLM